MTDEEVNALSKEEKIRWLEKKMSLERLALGAVSRCKTVTELRAAVRTYIASLAEQQGIGTTLVNLNRRFGVQCSRFLTTIRTLCQELVESGDVLVEATTLGSALIFDAALVRRAKAAGALEDVIEKTKKLNAKKRHSVE